MNQVQCNSLFAWCLNVEETGPAAPKQNPHMKQETHGNLIFCFTLCSYFILLYFFNLGDKVLLPTIKLLMINIHIINQIEIVLKEAS